MRWGDAAPLACKHAMARILTATVEITFLFSYFVSLEWFFRSRECRVPFFPWTQSRGVNGRGTTIASLGFDGQSFLGFGQSLIDCGYGNGIMWAVESFEARGGTRVSVGGPAGVDSGLCQPTVNHGQYSP